MRPAEHFQIRHTPIKWPNNARTAVCWVVNFECYSDTSDSFDIPSKDYSSKAAFRRLVNLFGKYDIKADWYTNGLIATRYPETLKELARLGHGFVGHNFANNVSMVNGTEEQERELIRRTLGDMEKASGVRPVGWFGSGSAGTAKTHALQAADDFLDLVISARSMTGIALGRKPEGMAARAHVEHVIDLFLTCYQPDADRAQ